MESSASRKWRVGLLFCVSVAERVLCASWLWAIHQQQRGFLQQQRTCYAAAAVMTTVVEGKRTLLPTTGTPCRVSRWIHHDASSNVRPVALDAGLLLNHREHDDRPQTLQLEFPSRISLRGVCPHVNRGLGCCFVSPLWRVCFVHPGSRTFISSSLSFYSSSVPATPLLL